MGIDTTEFIPISQLSSLPGKYLGNNDLLLVSRLESNILQSYNCKGYDIVEQLSALYYPLYNDEITNMRQEHNNFKSTMNTNFTNLSNDLYSKFNSLCDNINTRMTKIEDEWKLCADNMKHLYNDVTSLTTIISSNFASTQLCITLSAIEAIEWLKNNWKSYCDSDVKDWVDKNFVHLTGPDTINGTKTFVNTIEGTARKALWSD